jgi:hypothetical protein
MCDLDEVALTYLNLLTSNRLPKETVRLLVEFIWAVVGCPIANSGWFESKYIRYPPHWERVRQS